MDLKVIQVGPPTVGAGLAVGLEGPSVRAGALDVAGEGQPLLAGPGQAQVAAARILAWVLLL